MPWSMVTVYVYPPGRGEKTLSQENMTHTPFCQKTDLFVVNERVRSGLLFVAPTTPLLVARVPCGVSLGRFEALELPRRQLSSSQMFSSRRVKRASRGGSALHNLCATCCWNGQARVAI